MRLGIIGAGRVGASFVLAFPSDVEGILLPIPTVLNSHGTAMSSCSPYATMPWLPLAGNWPLP